MPENGETDPKDGNKEKTNQSGQSLEVNVEVSGKEEIEKLRQELDKAQKDKETNESTIKDLKGELLKLTEAKELTDEQKEDLQAKLALIADQTFKRARDEFIGKAKDLIPDEQIEEMEKIIDSPEKLAASKNMLVHLQTLKDQYIKSQEEANKKAEEEAKKREKANNQAAQGVSGGGASGKATLPSSTTNDGEVKGFESYKDMADELRKREKSRDPAVAEEAHKIMNTLFGKWITDIKENAAKSAFSTIELEKSFNQLVKEGLAEEREQKEKK